MLYKFEKFFKLIQIFQIKGGTTTKRKRSLRRRTISMNQIPGIPALAKTHIRALITLRKAVGGNCQLQLIKNTYITALYVVLMASAMAHIV